MDYFELGREIREARRSKKLTQAQVAENAEISISFLGHIERGTRKASLETIAKLCATLGISTDCILRSYSGLYIKTKFDGQNVSMEVVKKAREIIRYTLKLLDSNDI